MAGAFWAVAARLSASEDGSVPPVQAVNSNRKTAVKKMPIKRFQQSHLLYGNLVLSGIVCPYLSVCFFEFMISYANTECKRIFDSTEAAVH